MVNFGGEIIPQGFTYFFTQGIIYSAFIYHLTESQAGLLQKWSEYLVPRFHLKLGHPFLLLSLFLHFSAPQTDQPEFVALQERAVHSWLSVFTIIVLPQRRNAPTQLNEPFPFFSLQNQQQQHFRTHHLAVFVSKYSITVQFKQFPFPDQTKVLPIWQSTTVAIEFPSTRRAIRNPCVSSPE